MCCVPNGELRKVAGKAYVLSNNSKAKRVIHNHLRLLSTSPGEAQQKSKAIRKGLCEKVRGSRAFKMMRSLYEKLGKLDSGGSRL